MTVIVEIIRDLFIFVAVMFALFIVLIVVVSKMPDDNPLRRILSALSHRVGWTLGAGLVAIPIEPIPGIDALYDIAVPIALIVYWFTFFRDTIRSSSAAGIGPRPSGSRNRIGGDGRFKT
jgi:hypothetical protein